MLYISTMLHTLNQYNVICQLKKRTCFVHIYHVCGHMGYTNDVYCKVLKHFSQAIREDSSLYYSHMFYL